MSGTLKTCIKSRSWYTVGIYNLLLTIYWGDPSTIVLLILQASICVFVLYSKVCTHSQYGKCQKLHPKKILYFWFFEYERPVLTIYLYQILLYIFGNIVLSITRKVSLILLWLSLNCILISIFYFLVYNFPFSK